MKTILFFAAATFLATVSVSSVYAQVYDKEYAKSVVLAGGGSSTTNTYTIQAPSTLSSPISFTWPGSTGLFGILYNSSVGLLSWLSSISDPTDMAPGGNNTFLITNSSGTVAWNALNVDGTSLTGNGIGTSLGINLSNANTWTVGQTFQKNNVGTTSTDGLVILNSTSAANNAQQYSPRLRLSGQGYATSASSSDVDWMLQVVPVQGTSAPTSYLDFEDGASNSAYSSDFDLYSSGSATLGITVPSDPGAGTTAGIFNLDSGLQVNGAAQAGALLIANSNGVFVPTSITYPPSVGIAGSVVRSNGTNFIATSPNTLQDNSSKTYQQSSTSVTMMGDSITFTPTYSGKILIVVSGTLVNTPSDGGVSTVQLHYGTGTIPATDASSAGTATGSSFSLTTQNPDNHFFFSLTSILTGLQLNQTIWLDISVTSSSGSTTTVYSPTFTVHEF